MSGQRAGQPFRLRSGERLQTRAFGALHAGSKHVDLVDQSKQAVGMPFRPITTGQRVSGFKKHRSRELRKEMTPCERALWDRVRGEKFILKFRRSQIVDGFIVDFLCHQARLAFEVDGGIHDLQQAEDARRDAALRARGIEVMRVRNEEVEDNPEKVVDRIVSRCHARIADLTATREARRQRRSIHGSAPKARV
jgi:very-short-patch-repair endonuclease